MNKKPWDNWTKQMYDDIWKVQRNPSFLKESIVAIIVVIGVILILNIIL